MKNETRNKIRESREKYFQEVFNQKTEKKIMIKSKKEEPAEPEKEQKSLFEHIPSFTLPNLINREKMDRAMVSVKRNAGKLSGQVSDVKDSIANSIDQRTEKVRNKVFSYLLVLFDA